MAYGLDLAQMILQMFTCLQTDSLDHWNMTSMQNKYIENKRLVVVVAVRCNIYQKSTKDLREHAIIQSNLHFFVDVNTYREE